MPRLHAGLSIVGIIVCTIMGIGLIIGAGLPETEWISRDAVMPSITLTALDGQPKDIAPPFDEIILLNFWATWCIPCQTELPELELVESQNIAHVIAINMGENPATVARWLDQYGIELEIALDPTGIAYETYGIRGLPTTFIIQPDGHIQEIIYGAISADMIQQRLGQLP